MQSRQILRETIRKQRTSLTLEERAAAAEKMVQLLIANPVWQNSQCIAGYWSTNGEIDPSALFTLIWQTGKTAYLPILDPHHQLHFSQYKKNDRLFPNRYKIFEPELLPEKILAPQQLDLALVPLLGFDDHGNRLGQGAGYYDRTFAFLQHVSRPAKPILLGLAYEWQKVDQLAAAAWDIALDGVVTEVNFYDFGSRKN